MNRISIILALLLIISFSFWGCSRKGCTDKDSINYDSEAKQDDGSCAYTGKIIVWFTSQTAASFQTDFEADSFYVYINDNRVGVMKVKDTASAAPSCNATIGSFAVYLGSEKMGDCTLTLKKPVSTINPIVKSVNITVNANDCFFYQLEL